MFSLITAANHERGAAMAEAVRSLGVAFTEDCSDLQTLQLTGVADAEVG